jgi:protein-S-isoprenylcysteine O-methyltransferase Ste14
MRHNLVRSGSLFLLAVIFTGGLTFTTIVLPDVVDGVLQRTITTPGGDSHADAIARLKTELFIAHYHIRAVGYVAFFLLVGLIVLGFATRRTELAALGAVGVMLPVFAQFAGVMFFLAGLGVLNAVWLPILDISYELQHWGRVIDAPNDLLRWLLGLAGIHSMWPTTVFFIGSGILIFLLGVYAWLSARAQGRSVADAWVYRLSRHPQYLGWILWTYGLYLLLQRMHYPRRSWGIGASLPWLISTMVIVAVALVEELQMRRRHGEAYETYRRSAPFLFPVPRVVERLLSAPFRILFSKGRPDRRREIGVVVGLYAALLIGISAFAYGDGLRTTITRLSPPAARVAGMQQLVADIRRSPEYRSRYRLMTRLVAFGDPAVEPILDLLEGDDTGLKVLAAEALARLPAERAVPALCTALSDPDENVRFRSAIALGAVGSPDAATPLLPLLDDSVPHVRLVALNQLAVLGSTVVLDRVHEYLDSDEVWTRIGGINALGTLGDESGIPAIAQRLNDEADAVRREAVIALLRIGSPSARPILVRAVADDDWEVRVYAAETLKRLPGQLTGIP